MELDVLRGMDDDIKFFDFLSVECSVNPIYKGEATVFEVIRYLDWMGFSCDSNTDNLPAHDDVFFVNRRVKNPPAPPAPVPRGCFLNIGSGQRRFTGEGWINVDCVSRPGQVPDLLLDVGSEKLPYEDNSMDMAVLHHVYEHFGLGEGHGIVREINRVLAPGGRLIVTVPDMHALAERWLKGELANYNYMVNVYGAYQGEPGDRHKWGYNCPELMADLDRASTWKAIKKFDFRAIAGADIAQDWWILGVECVK
jgi:predicted SAM-dependent methyltransferase